MDTMERRGRHGASRRRASALLLSMALVLAGATTGCEALLDDPTAPASPSSETIAEPGASKPLSLAARLRSSSAAISCATGTKDLGVHTGYDRGAPLRLRLCAIRGFRSTSAESTPGHAFYVPGAQGNVIVNARVSGAVKRLFDSARTQGLILTANSSFRTHRHQSRLCAANRACRRGDFTFVAPAGFSNHQLGLAIDFVGTYAEGGTSCLHRAVDPDSDVWRFLHRHAGRFGYRQYSAESWHWDPMPGRDRCGSSRR